MALVDPALFREQFSNLPGWQGPSTEMEKKIENASIQDLVKWWRCEEPPEWASPAHSFFNALARALRHAGPRGVQFLKDQLRADDNPKKKSIALLELSQKGSADAEVIEYLVKAFYEEDPRWKECGLAGLIRSRQFILKRVCVERLLNSDDQWAAAAAMDYLCHAEPSEVIQLLRKGLQDLRPVVRAHACSNVGQRNIKELSEEVRRLLKDENQYVRNAAQAADELLELSSLNTFKG